VTAPKVSSEVKPVHIVANKEDIASKVVMAGDPLRVKYIAEKFLENPKLVNEVRGMLGYTGTYKGKRVTVIGHGMGMASMGIYAFELFCFYNVKEVIRVGTCGSNSKDLDIPDLILAKRSYTESNFAYTYNGDVTKLAYPSTALNERILANANKEGKSIHLGDVLCTEQFSFYSDEEHLLKRIPESVNPIGVEMETFALFKTATSFDCDASAILSVVDSKYSTKQLSVEERQTSLDDMITLALDSI